MKKYLFIALLVLALGGATLFGSYKYSTNRDTNNSDKKIIENLQASTTDLQARLDRSEKEKLDLVNALNEAASKNTAFATQLNAVTQKADKLEWLRQLDTQLLAKYSKVFFLNENYEPADIAPIDTKYLTDQKRTYQVGILYQVLPFLQKMLTDAEQADVTIKVASAYRSFDEQKSLKSSYTVRYGSGANAFSADQGYSEHQLGTTLDFTSPKVNGGLVTSFDKTDAFTWMKENAHKYGFTLSYPPNNKFYVYEPWHWRFVGIELATKLKTENKSFYDLDQREIDTYLGNMFNK
ncbi:MAG: M15 family metallopeptidase [Patescibacteria group bacterium]